MNRMISMSLGVRIVLLLLILTLGWTTIAQAQEGSADDQYGNPAAIPSVAASVSASPTSSASATGSASTSASGSASASAATALPSTGGATLFALGAGILLLGSGLLVRRTIR